jgi:predicted RNA-binding Zn ribbon-like protein
VQVHIPLTKRELVTTFLYMPMQSSRVRKPEAERTYRGEEEAQFLVGQLNGGRMIDRESIRQIILALKDVGDCRPITRQRVLSGDPTQIDEMGKIETVNKFLRQYEARPRLRLPSPLGGSIRLEWRCARRDVELNAVLIAVELARQGRIAKLKECANPSCKRWLFARFKHQRFCSDACYDLFHRTDEQDKERRRKWAKDNYRSRKELELGSRKAAQPKGGKG